MRFKHNRKSYWHVNPRNTLTCDMGYLVPIMIREALPGDTWKVNVADVIRLLPQLGTTYSDVNVSIMAFKVATRTIWDDFEKFRTGGKNNDDTTEAPYILHSHSANNVGWSTLSDYLGTAPALTFYTKDGNGVYQPNTQVCKSSALPERAYAKIINDWFINQNIQNELPMSTGNGNDTTTNTALWRRGWNHDYFTNATPYQQKGSEVVLPLGTSAPVSVFGTGKTLGLTDGTKNVGLNQIAISTGYYPQMKESAFNVNVGTSISGSSSALNGIGVTTDASKSGLKGTADLSSVSGLPISVLRLGVKTQEVAERLMLSGSRYVEWLKSFWGVQSADARLDRSEYVGGTSSNVIISPVMQTSSTDNVSPQGNISGNGYHSQITRTLKATFDEDGFFVVLMSIRPRTQYMQGLEKQFQRWTRMDYPLPAFAHLSEEPILNSEIVLTGVTNGTSSTDWDDTTLTDNQTFGFKPMFQEVRTIPSTIHGEFLNTLDYWTFGRKFDSVPALNSDFITCNPTKRPFAVQSGDVCLCDILFSVDLYRKFPKKGTPTM